MLLFFMSFSIASFGQKNSNTHKVKKGETLYSISKQHGITVEQLVNANPDSKDGLKTGNLLQIPDSSVQVKSENASKYLTHKVVAGETLYAISKKYDISIQTILVENPEIIDGLVIGRELRIPTLDPKTPTLVDSALMKKDVKKSASGKVHAALFLPLFVSDNFTDTSDIYRPSIVQHSKSPLEFYQGVLLACDSLTKSGMEIELTVIDTRNDSTKIKQSAGKLKNQSWDLMIGPLQSNDLPYVLKIANDKKIPLITPYSVPRSVVSNSPYLITSSASVQTQCEQMAAYLMKKYKNENIFFISTGLPKEVELIQSFKNKLGAGVTYPEIVYPKQGMVEIKQLLKAKTKDILIVCSSDESKVNNLLTSLKALKDSSLIVIGMPTWESFQSLDYLILQNLNVHGFNTIWIDRKNEETIKFRKKYRAFYNSEPSEFAYQGYDLALHFLNAETSKESNLTKYALGMEQQALHTRFVFKKSGENGGSENSYITIYQYKNLELKVCE